MPEKKDIFNRSISTPQNGKILTPEDIIILASSQVDLFDAVANKDIHEFLVQSFQYQYGMPSSMVRELGSRNQYIVNAPPQGSMTLSKVVGNKPITDLLSVKMLDHRYPGGILIIKPKEEFYTTEVLDESGNAVEYNIDYNLYFYGVKAEGISGGGDIGGLAIQETVSLRFSGMEYISLKTKA